MSRRTDAEGSIFCLVTRHWSLHLRHVHPAVDIQNVPGDIRGFFGSEKLDPVSNLLVDFRLTIAESSGWPPSALSHQVQRITIQADG